jgi:hypothetical protein
MAILNKPARLRHLREDYDHLVGWSDWSWQASPGRCFSKVDDSAGTLQEA